MPLGVKRTTLDLRTQPDGGSAIGRTWRLRRRTVHRLSRRRRRQEEADSEDGTSREEVPDPPEWPTREQSEIAEDEHEDSNSHQLPESSALPGSTRLLRRNVSMMGHPFGGRLSGGIRQWNPDLYRWLSDRMGTRGKMTLLLSLMLLQALSFVVHDAFEPGVFRGINTWSVEVAKHAASLVIALVVSLVLDGYWAVEKIFNWHPVWRFLGVSAMFSFATWFTQQAYKLETAHAAVVLLGYSYMPFAALLSVVVFKRRYGVLEWLSMGMMTLAACTAMLLRERYVAGGTERAVEWIREHLVPTGVLLTLCGVISSVTASILAENIFKERDRRLKSKWALGHDRFYIMKVHIEFSALLVALVIWSMPLGVGKALGVDTFGDWFGPWSKLEVLYIAVYIGLSWVAGLVTQQMNTVVKAIAQTLANVTCVMLADPILHDRYHFGLRAAPEIMLATIVLMSAIIFQTGRIIIHRLRGEIHSADESYAVTSSPEDQDAEDGPHGLFSTAPELDAPESPVSKQPAPPPESWCKRLATYSFMIMYVFVDTGRTLLNSYALTNSAINPTTMALFAFTISVLLLFSITSWSDGCKGVRQILQVKKLLESFPAALLFAVGQCLNTFAFALHISPALSNVLGKIYTPLAAFGGRCILDRYYSWLEYFAIIILTLASLVFGYLQEYSITTGLRLAGFPAVICALGSAVFAAFGSLTTERVLQGRKRSEGVQETEPYRIQKARLDIGSAAASLALLPVISLISGRTIDNIWVNRPVGTTNCTMCEPILPHGLPHWPWEQLPQSCSSDVCLGDCACLPSVIVGWNEPILVVALGVNVAHGWLIGKITKQFSTIHRAIADAFSTLLLYWVGEPAVNKLFKGVSYISCIQDMCMDMVSFVVPLSTLTFMVATSQTKEVMEEAGQDRCGDSVSLPSDSGISDGDSDSQESGGSSSSS